MKKHLSILFALVTVVAACSKKKDAPPAEGSATTTTTGSAATPPPPPPPEPTPGSAATGSGSDAAGSAAAADPAAAGTDSIEVHSLHKDPKNPNPVTVKFERFKVTKAAFDAKNLEGGTATIEVDVTSLKTDSAKRDAHLQTPDYLDASKFGTLTIDVANVKKKGEKDYTADAIVKLHGVEKKYPVVFEVVDAKDDWVKIKGEHKFSRLDFKVGKPASNKDEGVAEELTIAVNLTLKKT